MAKAKHTPKRVTKREKAPLIVFEADQGGFLLKEKLAKDLARQDIAWLDVGAHHLDPHDYYPEYGIKAASYISSRPKGKLGLFICSSGAGMCIAANKHKGVIAVNAHTESEAKFARAHNNANVLCLGGKQISFQMARKILKVFLSTSFEGGRHQKRVAMIAKIR